MNSGRRGLRKQASNGTAHHDLGPPCLGVHGWLSLQHRGRYARASALQAPIGAADTATCEDGRMTSQAWSAQLTRGTVPSLIGDRGSGRLRCSRMTATVRLARANISATAPGANGTTHPEASEDRM